MSKNEVFTIKEAIGLSLSEIKGRTIELDLSEAYEEFGGYEDEQSIKGVEILGIDLKKVKVTISFCFLDDFFELTKRGFKACFTITRELESLINVTKKQGYRPPKHIGDYYFNVEMEIEVETMQRVMELFDDFFEEWCNNVDYSFLDMLNEIDYA